MQDFLHPQYVSHQITRLHRRQRQSRSPPVRMSVPDPSLDVEVDGPPWKGADVVVICCYVMWFSPWSTWFILISPWFSIFKFVLGNLRLSWFSFVKILNTIALNDSDDHWELRVVMTSLLLLFLLFLLFFVIVPIGSSLGPSSQSFLIVFGPMLCCWWWWFALPPIVLWLMVFPWWVLGPHLLWLELSNEHCPKGDMLQSKSRHFIDECPLWKCKCPNGHNVPCSITGGLRTYIHMSVSVYSVVAMMLVEPCFVDLLLIY